VVQQLQLWCRGMGGGAQHTSVDWGVTAAAVGTSTNQAVLVMQREHEHTVPTACGSCAHLVVLRRGQLLFVQQRSIIRVCRQLSDDLGVGGRGGGGGFGGGSRAQQLAVADVDSSPLC
jgi:hypothetical protein